MYFELPGLYTPSLESLVFKALESWHFAAHYLGLGLIVWLFVQAVQRGYDCLRSDEALVTPAHPSRFFFHGFRRGPLWQLGLLWLLMVTVALTLHQTAIEHQDTTRTKDLLCAAWNVVHMGSMLLWVLAAGMVLVPRVTNRWKLLLPLWTGIPILDILTDLIFWYVRHRALVFIAPDDRADTWALAYNPALLLWMAAAAVTLLLAVARLKRIPPTQWPR
ncbi:MAG: hypothetical protein RLY93_14915 [Sumerlaeia bacterium]